MQQLNPSNLKDILLHSRDTKDIFIEIKVPPSRFKKIISDYYTINGISIDGMLENYSKEYDYYTLTKLDNNNNIYRIIKDHQVDEHKMKCAHCNCGRKRFINPITNDCYYHEMINKDYTTKIYIEEDENTDKKLRV